VNESWDWVQISDSEVATLLGIEPGINISENRVNPDENRMNKRRNHDLKDQVRAHQNRILTPKVSASVGKNVIWPRRAIKLRSSLSYQIRCGWRLNTNPVDSPREKLHSARELLICKQFASRY
jgi:hypothetical protein